MRQESGLSPVEEVSDTEHQNQTANRKSFSPCHSHPSRSSSRYSWLYSKMACLALLSLCLAALLSGHGVQGSPVAQAKLEVYQDPQKTAAAGAAVAVAESPSANPGASISRVRRQDETPPTGEGGGEGEHHEANEKERAGTRSTAGLVRKSTEHHMVSWPTGIGYIRQSRPINRFQGFG